MQVKVIITSRQQLLGDQDKNLRELVARLQDVMWEHEVEKLSKDNAEELFLRCTRKMVNEFLFVLFIYFVFLFLKCS